MLAALRWIVARIDQWLNPPVILAISGEDIQAIADIVYVDPAQGWYSWEAERFRVSGAHWFDPRRYDGTSLAFPNPTIADMQTNYRANEAECIATVGADTTNRATYYVYLETLAHPELREQHMAVLDPISWCIRRYESAGCPLVIPPVGWSGGSPSKALGELDRQRKLEQFYAITR